jgi:ribonuclease VapC
MVLDSSAILAILFKEPGFGDLEAKLLGSKIVLVGAPTLFETAMILQREAGGPVDLKDFLDAADVAVVPFEERHYTAALNAFVRFGKGRHPARLNILDCMSYATAEIADMPLLFTGDDFAKTDIEAA